MIPFRTQVKFFLENAAEVDLSQVAPVFQRWIQQRALEGQLIDVADYRHVFNGPGIVLIGHESDYALESRDGRLGLLYTRKRQTEEDLPAQLRSSLRLAVAAAQLLEADATLNPVMKFRADELEIRFADRLRLPNFPQTFELVLDDLSAVLREVYGGETLEIARVDNDPRELLTVAVRVPGVERIARLAQATQTAQ